MVRFHLTAHFTALEITLNPAQVVLLTLQQRNLGKLKIKAPNQLGKL
jgi:hypothetical protein